MLKEIKILIDELYLAGDSPDVTADVYADIAMPKVARIKELLDGVPDDSEIALTLEERQAMTEVLSMGIRKIRLEQGGSSDGVHDSSRSGLNMEEPKSGEASRDAKGSKDGAV